MSEKLFPWEGAMRFGLGVLRLSPESFWRMSPRELAAAFAAFRPSVGPAPGRAGLEAMMQRFPDEVGHGRE